MRTNCAVVLPMLLAARAAATDDPTRAAQALVRRVVPALADRIALELLDDTGTSAMQLDSCGAAPSEPHDTLMRA